VSAVKTSSKKARSRGSGSHQHRFGAHLSIAGGMSNAIREALRLKFDALQVFVKNRRQWRATPLKPDDLARWHELLAASKLAPVVAHATYLINLASSDDALYERSRDACAEELTRCQTLAIPYLVIHPGAAGPQPIEQAVARVAAALNQIFREHPNLRTTVLLETTAGQGTALGRSFAELGEIVALLDQPQRVGVCMDTCHVFAAGYDIRQPAGYQEMIAEAQQAVGLERIHCWHLNDCKGECGSRVDRHAHIGHGKIGTAGFQNVLADRRFRGLPMILETPKGANKKGRNWDRVNVQRLRTIATQVARA
jgi:deoxyribonuclease-4